MKNIIMILVSIMVLVVISGTINARTVPDKIFILNVSNLNVQETKTVTYDTPVVNNINNYSIPVNAGQYLNMGEADLNISWYSDSNAFKRKRRK